MSDAPSTPLAGALRPSISGSLSTLPRFRLSYPRHPSSAFIDADAPSAGHAIERATGQGLSVVLVSVDGSTRILKAELSTH